MKIKNDRTIGIVRESSNLNTVWVDDPVDPNKQKHINKYMSNNVGVDDHIDPKKQTYNKPMSNIVGAGLDQPDIKTGRSRPTPTRHKTKHCHYPNRPNNNNYSIINPCGYNAKYGNRR